MKGIYKKISVGVLAAALLVGGSGALQVGQAFAYSNYESLFVGDFDGYWDYSLIKDLKNKYDYKFKIRSISKQAPSERYDELEDRIDFMFLLKKGEQDVRIKDGGRVREGKVSIIGVKKGQHRVFKIGKYYYNIEFIAVR